MKFKSNAILLAFFAVSMSFSGHAEDDKFKGVDSLLDQIMSAKKNETEKVAVNQEAPKDKVERIHQKDARVPTLVQGDAAASAQDMVRVVDLPPYTKFTLKKNIVIPAYHSGALYSEGDLTFNVKEGNSPFIVLSKSPKQNICIFASDKNHIILRGYADLSGSSFVEVKSVSIVEQDGVMISQIDFFPKQAKSGVASDGISMSLLCKIPKEEYQDPASFTFDGIKGGVGDLFNLTIPNFIEI